MSLIKGALVAKFNTDSKVYFPVVEEAVQMLNEALSHVKPKVVFCISDRGSCDYEIEFVSERKMTVLTGGKGVWGFCDTINHKIYISTEATSSRTKSEMISTLMHEMLHAIGIPHCDREHALMYKMDMGVRGVTKYEVEAVTHVIKHSAGSGE